MGFNSGFKGLIEFIGTEESMHCSVHIVLSLVFISPIELVICKTTAVQLLRGLNHSYCSSRQGKCVVFHKSCVSPSRPACGHLYHLPVQVMSGGLVILLLT